MPPRTIHYDHGVTFWLPSRTDDLNVVVSSRLYLPKGVAVPLFADNVSKIITVVLHVTHFFT
jgi:hypothetical protein